MIEVLGDSARGDELAFVRLRVDGDPETFSRVHSNLIDGYAELPITWDRIAPAT